MKEIYIDDSAYPELLRHIADPPAVLYAIGDTGLLPQNAWLWWGRRKASPYGKWVSYNIGRRLAEYGIVTVSGMAFGCDSEAHRGALEAGGGTVAVMGCGADICYPASNAALRRKIRGKRSDSVRIPAGNASAPLYLPSPQPDYQRHFGGRGRGGGRSGQRISDHGGLRCGTGKNALRRSGKYICLRQHRMQ